MHSKEYHGQVSPPMPFWGPALPSPEILNAPAFRLHIQYAANTEKESVHRGGIHQTPELPAEKSQNPDDTVGNLRYLKSCGSAGRHRYPAPFLPMKNASDLRLRHFVVIPVPVFSMSES